METFKRLFRFLSAAISLAMAALLATGRRGGASAERDTEATASSDPGTPNILIFLIDDLDSTTFDQMLAANQLPNIKSRIVDRSVHFSNTFVPGSICSPSRASILTGKYSHNHGVWHVAGNEGPQKFKDYLAATDDGYLPRWLSQTHYRAFIGKYHLGPRHPHWDFFSEVDGYDPRPGMYRTVENGVTRRPNLYQTKYIGDTAKKAISQSGNKPVFMVVSPLATHVSISNWGQRPAQAQAEFSGRPVALSQFIQDDSGTWRQHLVTVDFSSGAPVYVWWDRDSPDRDSNWGDWRRVGDAAIVAPNTGNKAVVGWNVLLPSATIKRQQLVRQAGADVEFYARDIVEGQGAKPWALTTDESTLNGTGSLPVAAWAAVTFPSGVIRQQVLRGNETQGYVSYVRHYRPSTNQLTAWRLDPDWGEPVVFGTLCGFTVIPTKDARYIIKLIVRRPGSTKYEWWQCSEQVDFMELSATTAVGASLDEKGAGDKIPSEADQYRDPAMRYRSQGISQKDKAEAGGQGEGSSAGTTAAGDSLVIRPVHPYFLLRAFAEGNWSPVVTGQTYNYAGNIPAGSLRENREPNGFRPFSAQFDLPRTKPSFNRQADVDLPFFSPQTWPDLTDPVQGNKQQQDYLSRLNLDRMEQLLSVDRMVAEVVDAAGSNTVIIFTSDNGHFGGQHRLGNKLTAHEESVHVPLYISGPGIAPRQMTQLVANIDIAPTVIDYAGRSWTNPDFKVDGRSLRQMLEGASGANWRSSLLLEFHKPRGLPGGDSATDWRFGLPDYLGLRQIHGGGGSAVNSLYVQYYSNIDNPGSVTEVEQYDLTTDPNQTDNLATGQIGAIDQILRDFYVASGPAARVQDTRVWPS